jgi:hypothetical protein
MSITAAKLTAPVKKRRGWILKDRIYPRKEITTELTEWTKLSRKAQDT